jgi:hypothetical protein
MTTIEPHWIGKTVVIDWPLTNFGDPPLPVTDATLAGTVTKPNSSTAAMTTAQVGDIARFTYVPTASGLHAYKLEASGSVVSSAEGTFYVKPSPAFGPPPTFDPTTEIGQVRLLASDVDEDNLLFTDTQVTAFLTMETGVKRAAAAALEVIATSEVLVSKVIRTQDLATDGAKLSAELRARAKTLREQADVDDDNADDGGFEIAYFEPGRGPELAERTVC